MKKTLKFLSLLFLILGAVLVIAGCKKDVKIESISVISESVPASILTTEIDQKITEIKIKVEKSDDSEEIINVSKSMINEADYAKLATEGTYTITITYEGFETKVLLTTKKPTNVNPGDKSPIEYSVLVQDIAGKPLNGFYVEFYKGNEIVGEGYTNALGTYATNLTPDKYRVVVDTAEGYFLNQEVFETDLIGSQIIVEAGLENFAGIEAEKGHIYELGDIMYDFTLEDTEGNELNLYTLLDEYKVVILNFWYTTCSACYYEFPYMVEAYESSYTNKYGETVNYSDEVCIIAVNPGFAGDGDTLEEVISFKQSMGLSFNVAMDYDNDQSNLTLDAALTSMFQIKAYPTTVIIDSYGLIAEAEEGAVTATEKWTQTFDKYISDDYVPVYSGDVKEDEFIKPDIVQEDSSLLEAAINGTNYDGSKFSGQWVPEDHEKDKEFSWPWIVEEFEGKTAIRSSNKDISPSFSIVYTTVDLKKGEVFAFDYYASTEEYDTLYVTANGVIATSITGVSPDWETSYAFVAIEEGTYEIGFCYLKDESYSHGEDTVYITNVRIVEEEDIDKETYIFRECATGTINELTMSYSSYATVVYNPDDGYYHVGTANGPLLLADMLSGTQWNLSTLYEISLEGKCIGADSVDYNKIIEEYSIYASNSEVGYTPVTEELAAALKQVVKALGDEVAASNQNQWLEVCVYYSAYATPNGEELGLPTVGVMPWEPIEFNGNGINSPATAEGDVNRIILPRGYIFGFTPEVSGVYKFYTTETLETLGWFCDKDGNVIQDQETGLRIFAQNSANNIESDPNCQVYVYLEAGVTHLFRAAFWDVTEFSVISVAVEYVAPTLELLTVASPGFFTSSDDEMSDIISGNFIDVEIGQDGFYHVTGSNSSDTFVYCDVEYVNNITGYSLLTCLSDKFNAFDFSKDEFGNKIVDEEGYSRYSGYNEEGELVSFYVCVDSEGEYQYVETLGVPGLTYVKYTQEEIEALGQADFTQYVENYIAANKVTDTSSELYGCVKVDEKFAVVLGLLMDKYTFPDVEYSWVKLCYYYKYVGPQTLE